MSIVLGLGGVSCGGKTSLAKALQGDWHGAAAAVSVVHQDDYYWLSSRLSTFQTKAPYVASYDGNSCCREQSAKTSLGSLIGARHHTVVVVEGNMLYNSPKLDSLFDFRLFFTLPYELCKARRLRRAYEPPEPEGYFDSVCWPRYTETLQAARTRDDVVMVDASPPLDAIRTEVEMRIEDLLVSAKRVGCLP